VNGKDYTGAQQFTPNAKVKHPFSPKETSINALRKAIKRTRNAKHRVQRERNSVPLQIILFFGFLLSYITDYFLQSICNAYLHLVKLKSTFMLSKMGKEMLLQSKDIKSFMAEERMGKKPICANKQEYCAGR